MEGVTHNIEVTDGGERERMLRVDVIIPAYKSGKKFSGLLKMLSMQTYPIGKITIMSTEKAYWNEKGSEGIDNLEMHHLSKEESDRGATRDRGVRYSRTDTMVFMTDNAAPADEELIENLTAAFEKGRPGGESVIMTYARQLPDKDCTIAERFIRSLNYPGDSCIKIKEDLGRMGIKTLFASNACCTYDREKFWFQGDFIHKTIFNEDVISMGKAVLQDDYAIAYVTEARAIHSHSCGCTAQLRHNFDLVVSQADHPEVFGGIRSEGEGTRLARQIARYLVAHRRPWLVPGLIAKSGFKYAGYRLGRYYRFLPIKLAAACSMNKEYRK